MSEQDVKIKINRVTDESIESTRRMLQMVGESQEKGKETMIMLDKQGKQLRNTEVNMDEIKENVKTAERNLNEMSKCCGWCLLKSIENDQRCIKVWGTEERDGGVVSSQVTAVRNIRGVTVQSTASSGTYIKRITNDAQEKELEENLEQVGSIIGNLKNMAIDINNELDKQNKTIDRITDKVEITTDHVEAATKKAKHLIKE
ncbi:synaptosomal-associated protein 23 [Triplophysa rosa]|uniref:Synaptosomal-associated protein n=1 Tax=Triplophysa rosa TaxID=992332 RepID=A0A9W7WLV5_TRIRA|nr:synaptosomal-associated protein 23 [Triplophysa rosa]